MTSRTDVTLAIGSSKVKPCVVPVRVAEYFGENTFKEETMCRMVSEKTFVAFKKWQDEGMVISALQADEIANALKEWALAKGATSYTHWFQPMTGQTAEKHDSFIHINGPCQVLEKFTGKKLIQGEPDASSFPSGGLRATFEARGYTAWDPSSPAFITAVELGKTLCIPSIFISYTGQALDKKLPLLRSEAALSRATVELLRLFGHSDARGVHSDCGPEQEYFLVDQGFFKLRCDLQLTGRTLIGAPSPKGQQLEDQYFGSIKERVLNYMHEVTQEAYALGIPVSTRHNEVAPHQFEFAPIFERSNLAADHNQLLMDIMKKVAKRHGLECLLHEKPFEGINGSGKHLNWSLADDKGNNLLNPGDTPETNLLFLAILVSVITAVHEHADLLLASVASAGNEHRLGANEAPPAIMSVFLGEQLTHTLENIESGKKRKVTRKDIVDLGLSTLPSFSRDTTDRNRTSPFAYTGSKFEFRACGSSANISTAITVLNTIVAEAVTDMTAAIKNALKGRKFENAVFSVLTDAISRHKAVLFEGDNYSEEWIREAKRRGLQNAASAPQALRAFVSGSSIKVFEKHRVLTGEELNARYRIWLDIYNKIISIEARTLMEMVATQVLPAAFDFQIEVGNSLDILKEIADDQSVAIPIGAVEERREMFAKLTADIYYVRKNTRLLADMLASADLMAEAKRAAFLTAEVKPHMAHVRRHVDELEGVMPDDQWLPPKYREMLFIA
jgi:glutamine synthetase